MRTRIMIVEDHQVQRYALQAALEARGFEVKAARNLAEVKALFATDEVGFDVVVLDMLLGKEDGNVTGADVGIDIQKKLRHNPPEFIIYSFQQDKQYLRKALQLGPAKYFDKSENSRHDLNRDRELIAHVRALALRKQLAARFLGYQTIADSTMLDAGLRYCLDVLGPAVASTIGTSALILLDDSETTARCVIRCTVDGTVSQTPWDETYVRYLEVNGDHSTDATGVTVHENALVLHIAITSPVDTGDHPLDQPATLAEAINEHLPTLLGKHLSLLGNA